MLSEKFAAFRGGPGFIYALGILLCGWVAWNFAPGLPHFDRPPGEPSFTFLNLLLSIEAAFAMPVILMSQARAQAVESGKLKQVLDATNELLRRLESVEEDVEEIADDLSNGGNDG